MGIFSPEEFVEVRKTGKSGVVEEKINFGHWVGVAAVESFKACIRNVF